MARWRSGNAGVCKTPMRRFNSGTRLHMSTPGFYEAEVDVIGLVADAGLGVDAPAESGARHASYHVHIREGKISKKTRALLDLLDKPRAIIRRHGSLWRVMVDPTIGEDHGRRGVTSLDYTLVETKNRRW